MWADDSAPTHPDDPNPSICNTRFLATDVLLTLAFEGTVRKRKLRTIRVIMILRCLLMLVGITTSSLVWSQEPEGSAPPPPLLTLDDAVRIATSQNREVQISVIDITKAKEEVTQDKTNY